jgi:hypothetical protein
MHAAGENERNNVNKRRRPLNDQGIGRFNELSNGIHRGLSFACAEKA